MRLIVTLFVFMLSVSACKRDSEAEKIDPREQYLGTYDIDYTSKTTVTPGFPEFSEDAGKGTFIFTKGDAANELKIEIAFPGAISITEVAKLNGTKFTLNRTRNKIIFGNKEYEGEYAGIGTFEGRNVTLTGVTKLTQPGVVVQWTQSYKGLKR